MGEGWWEGRGGGGVRGVGGMMDGGGGVWLGRRRGVGRG